MSKRIFFWGLTAGVLSAVASLAFLAIHRFETYTDFSKVVKVPRLIGLNLGACMLAALGYSLLQRFWEKGEWAFNLAFSVFSFASVIIPISATLPLDVQSPELFPGLAVPMHFFPALAWYTIRPFFAASPVR